MVNATLYQGNAVQQLKADVVSLQQKIKSQIEAERVRAFEIIDELKAKLVGFEEFKLLDTDKQAHLSQAFEEAVSKINGQSLIAMIRDETRRFEEQHFSFLIQQVDEWNAEQPILEEKAADPVDAVSSTDIENNVNKDIKQNTKPLSDSLSKPLSSSPSKPPSKAQESKPIVSLKQLKTSYARPWINSEKDVDEYLTNLRQLLQKELSEGKKIQVY